MILYTIVTKYITIRDFASENFSPYVDVKFENYFSQEEAKKRFEFLVSELEEVAVNLKEAKEFTEIRDVEFEKSNKQMIYRPYARLCYICETDYFIEETKLQMCSTADTPKEKG